MRHRPIRIAHIMGKWLGGGVESVVMNYYRNIDRDKIQFDFICDEDSTDIPYEEIKQLGGKIILIPPYQKIFKYHKKLKKILRDRNYKIVHSHINTISVFALFAAKRAGVPIRIAHSHSTTNKAEKKKDLLKRFLKHFSKLFATHYFACSEYAARWLFGKKTFEGNKVFILNNAINVNKFKYDKYLREEVRRELNISDDMFVIGHVGRFVKQKNHTFLIDVFHEIYRKNKKTILLLVGQGPLKEKIEEIVKKLGIEKNVRFLGQRSDVDRLYQAFDVFVLPSLYEGLPVVGVEAQAAGLLCFFSYNMTNETKIIESTIFLDLTETSMEWSEKIIDNYKNYKRESTVKEISDKGFNIEVAADKLANLYNSMCEGKI